MLVLPIKKKWFDMILEQDIKKRKMDEYRAFNDYWGKRFATVLGFKSKEELDENIKQHGRTQTFFVKLRNGYSTNSPYIIAEVSLSIGTGKEEWGAELNKKYYVLKIQKGAEE